MLPVITLPQADKDSDLFFLYIAKDNSSVAYYFLDMLEEIYQLISSSPKLAPVFETSNPKLKDIRWFPVKDSPKHLIIYIESETQITIVRVLHKAQNISEILKENLIKSIRI